MAATARNDSPATISTMPATRIILLLAFVFIMSLAPFFHPNYFDVKLFTAARAASRGSCQRFLTTCIQNMDGSTPNQWSSGNSK
jgi:hypothetical protein